VSYGDVVMVAFIASMGLTVSLFIAGEAFTGELQEQAKMGALLSALVGPAALAINLYIRLPLLNNSAVKGGGDEEDGGGGGGDEDEFGVNSRLMRSAGEVDENVVRAGLVRILKRRHAAFARKRAWSAANMHEAPQAQL